jgi:hypothetical protein
MQCPFCGTQLPSNAQVCTTCGNAVNVNSQGANIPTQYANPMDPNQLSTQYPNSMNPNQVPPPPAYGAPQPSSPYNQPYPSQETPYQPYQQPGVPPYQPIPGQLGAPYSGNAPYPGAIPGYIPPQKKPKSRVGLIVGIIALVLVVLCIGGSVLAVQIANESDQTDTTQKTPTASQATKVVITPIVPYTQQESPSGTAIDSQAAEIIINPQTASKIDKDSLEPVKGSTTSTFKTNQSIYVTFDLDPKKFDATKETDYINTRFYVGSKSVLKDDPLKVGPTNFNGYFSADYYQPTDEGAVEFYWCHTASCSDAKLAQVLYFTVTD